MIAFYYLKKNEFDKYADRLFSILYDNMNKIAPTGNSRNEDFNSWFIAVQEELENDKRHLIIIFQEDLQEIIGFFKYSVNEKIFLMEELQIKASYQGNHNIFRNLYGFILEHITEEVYTLEAYAHKENKKSIGILKHLGLSIVGENKNGISYRFQGAYSDLLNWYHRLTLRNFRDSDAEVFREKHSKHLSQEEILELFQQWNKKDYNGRYFEMFAILKDQQIVGRISLYQHSESAVSCGPEIFEDYHRQGIATEAMELAMDIAKHKGYKIVFQQIRADNIASIALHNKLGFETDGYVYKNRKGTDVVIYLKVLT